MNHDQAPVAAYVQLEPKLFKMAQDFYPNLEFRVYSLAGAGLCSFTKGKISVLSWCFFLSKQPAKA
ncbi:MAG: hypothetical protein HN802_01980 [Candidatus Jacksonbacteria bacterium]|jgi:hypothetical protein|nr:hypothetical protein [Candidatus Jacksonbacteria bacterium]MBT7008490.1 hypothetical protein [Candidatus Jacksonbacteria bacterium]MBT7338447.1 hypothetical protein [Candidatus Jacksonbacteria bacterium]